MKRKKIIILSVAAVAVIVIVWAIFGRKSSSNSYYIETATAARGDVSNSVTATGSIEPVTQVEVGTQVSGIIDKLYADYNSVVTKGQLIAEMDKVTLQSELTSQQATYDGAKAEYEYQQKNYLRNQALHEKQLISDTEFEESTYNYAKATMKAAKPTWPRPNAIWPTPPSPRPSTGWSSAAPLRRDRPWQPDSRRLPSSPSPPTSPRCR